MRPDDAVFSRSRRDRTAAPEPAVRIPALVALGSSNPAKRRGVEMALRLAFSGHVPPLVSVGVASGVPSQPWGEGQTRRGAEARALHALAQAGHDDAVGVGVEGGLVRRGRYVWSFSWAVARAHDGTRGVARSAAFPLPPTLAARVEAGQELGDAVDAVFGVRDAKRAGGAVGMLTAGALDRADLYAQMVVLALLPILRDPLYRSPGTAS